MKQLLFAGSACCCLVLPLVLRIPETPVKPAGRAADPELPVKIKLSLDKSEATPGELVRLQETIPIDLKGDVISVMHTAACIGRYDEKNKSLVNEEPADFLYAPVDMYFDHLPWNSAFACRMPFELLTPRSKGTEFEFRPKKLGIFLITVTWSLSAPKQEIASQPVILVVHPPTDTDGKPLVKPEWLYGN